jgi:hydroxyacylglutathione hydrolase
MILEVFPSGPIETNGYLLGCSESGVAAVIDAPFDSFEPITKRAKKLGLKITHLLLTHSHWDHIGQASDFKEKLGCLVWIHEADAPNLINPGADRLPLYGEQKGVVPDRFLVDGEEFHIGSLKVKVIHTPGHTPGCICFYIASEKTVLSGDTLFCGGIGRLDLPTGQPKLMRASLEKLFLLPPDTQVYPGHGEPTTIESEIGAD